jgi:hypothetical protein
MDYKYLNRSVALEHLQEGQAINIDEYIEKLRFFKKYTLACSNSKLLIPFSILNAVLFMVSYPPKLNMLCCDYFIICRNPGCWHITAG